ncbi:sensor histidine kinase [Winogradskyella sp. SYSU M77433]|uniref:tetratricopeptide repeat-containing sensor histidine kinase n=1 Tax=Winogradskyella sp. SYSU M77433 TaxID=3042722 RepID=UPI00247FFC9C|nr:sensor histidine kinase [Winogradskyella sp. SYSU M77433]MDH7911283.1 sensor histidine kinase [Winogradskyella sp. SYSU M77433]
MKSLFTYLFLVFTMAIYSQQRQILMDSLLNVTQESKDSSRVALAHSRLAWMYLNSDVSTAKEHLDTSMVVYSKLKDMDGVAISNYKYAVYNRVIGNYPEAHRFIDFYIDYAKEQRDTFKIANSAYQKGVIYSLQTDYESSLKEYHKTLRLYEAIKDSASIGFTLNSIGIVYKNLKKYDKAIENYEQAIALHQKMNDKGNLANVYNSIGAVYAEQEKSDEALEYFKIALDLDKEIGNNWGTAKVGNNIGHVYIENGKYNEALSYLTNALKIQREHNYEADIAETLTQLSVVHFNLGNYQKSEALIKEAFENDIPSVKEYQTAHQQAYRIYNATNQPKKALEHYKAYTIYKDSIFNENNLKNINALQIQFETEKKDKSILQQQITLQEQEIEIQKKDRRFLYVSGLVVLLLLIAIASWIVFRQKQKRKNQELITLKREYQIKSLESLIEGEEKERLRIAKELHDGVNGDLSAIKHKLSTLLEMNNNVINEAIAMIDSSCEQVRAISHNLVPPSLENFNLIEATENYCANLDAVSKEQITFQHLGDDISLTKKAEVNAFRIIQELITNALKHAEASEINVQISHRDNLVQITVEDDGKGFDKNNVDSQGIGLSNIQSRVDYLNANLDVISNAQGTSYTIDIDLNNMNDN